MALQGCAVWCSSRTTRHHLSPSAPAPAPRRPSRLAVNAIAAPKEVDALPSVGALEAELQRRVAAATAAAAAPTTTGRVVLESPEELRSTWEHRAWVGSATTLMAATLATGLSGVEGVEGALEAGAALFAAYVLADLGTAFYHW